MKRYLAFYGSVYYPCGGMGDFIGDFDTPIEAKESIIKKHTLNFKDETWKYNWYHVWDSETMTIIDQG